MDDILNFIQIDERTALAGQPSEMHFHALHDQGYGVVINLAPNTTVDGVELDEPALLARLGIDYHHIPVPWTAPDRSHYEAFAAAMAQAGQRRTLVHCAMNYRVTAFYSIYAMEELGWSREQADALLDRVWNSDPRFTLDGIWKDFIEGSRRAA